MDRVIDIQLVPTVPVRTAGDQIGESARMLRSVVATRGPITRAEYTSAGLIGVTPSMVLTLACCDDYEGEQYAIVSGERYHIYRTYETSSGGIELYLERRAGDRTSRIMR